MTTRFDETGQVKQPFYKRKAFIVPAALYGVFKAAGKIRSAVQDRRRKKVIRRIDQRQRAEARQRRQRSYRRRTPRPRR